MTLGNATYRKIYLGDTERQKIYIGANLWFGGASAWSRAANLDIDLDAGVNPSPRGIWADSTHWYVVNSTAPESVRAYTRAGVRDASRDFTSLDAGNVNSTGLWSDGTTLWISEAGDTPKLFAYNLATKARDASNDFNTLAGAGNQHPNGMWSNGTYMWVSDSNHDAIYAYDFTTKARVPAQDFNIRTIQASGVNRTARGIWSDGSLMYVQDGSDDRIYAYDLNTKAYVESHTSHFLSPYGNADGYDVWADGTTMWVCDGNDRKLYAYTMPTDPYGPPAMMTQFQQLAALPSASVIHFTARVAVSGNYFQENNGQGTLIESSPSGMFTDSSIIWLNRFRIASSGGNNQIHLHRGGSSVDWFEYDDTWTDSWALYCINLSAEEHLILQANDTQSVGGGFINWRGDAWTIVHTNILVPENTGDLRAWYGDEIIVALAADNTWRPSWV